MLKYLRIAVTALCLTACVLLVALWVRSYHFADNCYGHIPGNNFIAAGSQLGYLYALFSQEPGRDWSFSTTALPDERWRKTYRENKPTKPPNRLGLGVSYPYASYTTVCVPYWFLTLLLTLLALAPWGRHRFSLRTLLIATTLVAVGLGIVAAF